MRSPETFTHCASCSSRQTRWYGLWLSVTIAPVASWIAAQTAWIPAPPPSPMPFVPSGVNGDGLSIAPVASGGMSSACGTW